MGKKKVSIIMMAVLTCIVCISMIAGATFALFTDNDRVDVSVTTAKLNVSADIGEITTTSSLEIENSQLTTDYNTETKTLSVTNMLPGDIVTFPVTITSKATVDIKYRLSFGASKDGVGSIELFDELLLGVKDAAADNYQYYVSSVSAWEPIAYSADASKMAVTKYVAIELPEFVNAKALEGETCNIEFAVEAVQGNAPWASEAEAVRAFRATDDATLNAAVESVQSVKDVIILDGSEVTDWNLTYTGEAKKTFTLKGNNVGTINIDARNATIEYLINESAEINVIAVDGQSMHIYGQVGALTVNEGHVVVEQSAAITESMLVEPKQDDNAVIEVKTSAVPTLTVPETAQGTASISIAKDVTVAIENNSATVKPEIKNEGTITGVTGAGSGNVMIKSEVFDANSFNAAIALGGEITFLNSIELNSSSTLTYRKNVSINLNENTFTLTSAASPAMTVAAGCTVEISNGKFVSDITRSSSTSVTGVEVKGSLYMNGVDSAINLTWGRTRDCNFYLYNVSGNAEFTNCNIDGVATSTGNYVVTTHGMSVSGDVVVNGGTITGGYGIKMASSVGGTVTVSNVNINYLVNGIVATYAPCKIVLGSDVTFSGAMDNAAIVLQNQAALDDQSGTEWTLDKRFANCGSYPSVMVDQYVCGNVIKQVYTTEPAEHTDGEIVYDEFFNQYNLICSVCGCEIRTVAQAGDSEEFYYPVTDFYSLRNAALNATNYIKLLNDIDVDYSEILMFKTGCTLDLNGKTITARETCDLEMSGTNIAVINGNIVVPTGHSYALRLRNATNATLKNIDFKGGINLISSSATIVNCSADANGSEYYAVYASGNGSNVTIESGTFVCGTYGMVTYAEKGANIVINGGNFTGLLGGDGATVNGGTFVSNAATAADLTSALAANLTNHTIVLTEDITVSAAMNVSHSVTVNLNGHVITNNVEKGRPFYINASDVTISIDGTVDGSSMIIPETNAYSYGFVDMQGLNATVIINGGRYIGNMDEGTFFKSRYNGWTIEMNDAICETNYSIVNHDISIIDGTLKVNGGKVTLTGNNNWAAFRVFACETTMTDLVIESEYRLCAQFGSRTTTLNNCTFGSPKNNSVASWLEVGAAITNGGTMNINGGTYKGQSAVAVYNSGGTININGGSFIGNNAVRIDGSVNDNPSVANIKSGEFTGKMTSSGNAVINFVDGTVYVATADELAAAIKVGATNIVLTEDIEITENVVIDGKKININLNGQTLSRNNFEYSAIVVNNGGTLTFSNGKIEYFKDYAVNNAAVLVVKADSSAILDGVTFETSQSALYAEDTASKIVVKNHSVIKGGYFAISTNNGVSGQSVEFVVTDSTLTTFDESLSTAFFTSVPCNVTIERSTLSGALHGAYVRAGTVTIKDSTLICRATEDLTRWDDDWATSGNGAPYAALAIGSHNNNGTYSKATVTLQNTTLNGGVKNDLVITADQNGSELIHDIVDTSKWFIVDDGYGDLTITYKETVSE